MQLLTKDIPVKAPILGRRYFHVCYWCKEKNLTFEVVNISDNAYKFICSDGDPMYVLQEWLDDGKEIFYEIIEEKNKQWLSHQLIDMYKGEF